MGQSADDLLDMMPVPNGNKLTVRNVMEYRTQFLAVHQALMTSKVGDKYANRVYGYFKDAEIVIWDPDIFDLAISGSEAFRNTEIGPLITAQLWCCTGGPFHINDECIAPFLFFDTNGKLSVLAWRSDGPLLMAHNKSMGAPNDYLAAMAFLNTKVAVKEKQIFSRSVEKHWKKRNIHLPTINVVTLRRSEQTHGGSGKQRAVNWSHRWAVRPHWRSQVCGKERSERRQTFIEMYVKGPEDRPLILKDTVFSARR